MGIAEWVLWAALLFAQQFTFLFSGRAKSSGSLTYSFVAGLGSHSTWFFSNLYFVRSILEFRDSPLLVKLGVCAFYVTFCQAGTQLALRIAKRIERGNMRVGA
ncbi:MAG: hypothetical protein ACREI9_13050 [Nitrospiraceae bacterium]